MVSISNLQRSQYGKQYYVNQGFWLRSIDNERYPKSERAHIVCRLDSLLPDAENRIAELLDLENDVGERERETELTALLIGRLLPLVDRGSTVAGLKAMVAAGTFAGAGIRGPAQHALGLTS